MSAIVANCVSKRFTLHQDRPRSLQELVLGTLRRSNSSRRQEFWALKDVSFAVRPGEAVGIIGENGSGKSTLLKLITRILAPTRGYIETKGRIAALLELGAGFHPDLTGRENIYLNGSILGLGRREMDAKMEDIVSFAELERFIDVPLKHYSSGMQVRLGFAIATSTDPDILLIDEVLAVGDEAFQHKCLDRIAGFRARGKTIVFVSHDLGTVNELCERAIWLDDGVIRAQGLTRRVVDLYLTSVGEKENLQLVTQRQQEAAPSQPVEVPRREEPLPEPTEEPKHWGTGEIQITDVRLLGEEGQHKHLFYCGEPLTIEIYYLARRSADDVVFGVGLYRSDGMYCYGTNTDIEQHPLALTPGAGSVSVHFDRFAFIEGTYSLDVAIHTSKGLAYDYYRGYHTLAVRSRWKDAGVFRPTHRWVLNGRSYRMDDRGPKAVEDLAHLAG